MIKHVVCFKLNEGEDPVRAKEVLMSMRGNVPTVKDIEVGVDFLHSPRSYDVILTVILENRAVLEQYQNDPYHVNVVKKHMHAVTKSSVAVDYDINVNEL